MLWTVAIAEFMLVLDVSVVNVAVPNIRRDMGFDAGGLDWVVNAYVLTFGGALLLGGRAADLLGRRRAFVAGLGAFTVASLVCGLAPSPTLPVVARAAQGLSAATLAPTTLSILTVTFTEGGPRRRALATWTAVSIGGGAAGGLVGGVVTHALSWRYVFLLNVPIGVTLTGEAA